MATVSWITGNGDWSTASNWNTKVVPASSDSALIGGAGARTVTVTNPITVRSITTADISAILAVSTPGSTCSVALGLTNGGTLLVDNGGGGGSKLAIAGTLANSNVIQIGNGSVASTVTAGALKNTGQITIAGGSANKAVLSIAAAAPATWGGTVNLSGNALLEFGGTGQITAIGGNGTLNLSGSQAFVAVDGIGTTSNSALGKLAKNAGNLQLDLGSSVTTSVGLINSGNMAFGRGAKFSIGGTLTNYNTATVSASNGQGATTMTAAGMKNYRAVNLQGNSATDVALLTINGNASNYADVSINAFAKMNVTGSYSQYAGFTTDAGTLTVAASSIAGGELNVAGILNGSVTLSRGVIEGSGTINGDVTETGGTILGGTIGGDAYSYNNGLYTPGAPGGPLTINGAFTERGASVVEVLRGAASGQFSTINVSGSVLLQGGALQVDIDGGSGFNVTAGQVFTVMTFNPGSLSGKFSTIQDGAFIGNGDSVDIGGGLTLKVVYNNAAGNIQLQAINSPTSGDHWLGGTGDWNDAGKWSSGIPGASTAAIIDVGSGTYDQGAYTVTIDHPTSIGSITFADSPWGTLAINDPWNLAGTGPQYSPMAVTVAGSLTNASGMAVDYNGPYATPGGTVLSIGGTLDNGRQLTIGSQTVASTSVSAAKLINTGNILLLSSGVTQSTLKIAGSAGFGETGIVTGRVNLYGNDNSNGHVLLEFGSGQITSIASGASLELHGSSSFVADSGSTSSNSALTGLTNIGGRGNNGGSFQLLDGAVVNTTVGLTNAGNLSVDYAGPYAVTGGSKLGIGGVLTNVGAVAIGNGSTSKVTTVTATGLVNNGRITLTGAPAVTATLNVAGAAGFGTAGLLTGNVSLSGNALLEFGSGQITSIASGGASLSLTGNQSFVANSSGLSSNSAITGLSSIGGGFGTGLTLLDGASVTTTTSLINAGGLAVDNNGPYFVDGGSKLGIGGTLTNTGRVTIGAGSITKATTVTTNGLINTGLMDLAGSSKAQATMTVNGATTNSGTITVGAGAVLTLNGASNTLSGTFTGAGETDVVGAATIIGSLTETGGTLRFLGGTTNEGVLVADGGTLFVDDTPTGSGTFQVGNGGLIDFAGTRTTQTVGFQPSTGTVALGDLSQFHAGISGFGAGDVIDLKNVSSGSISNYVYSGGYLKLTTAAGTNSLHVQGSYTTANFTLGTDSSGLGTAITFHA